MLLMPGMGVLAMPVNLYRSLAGKRTGLYRSQYSLSVELQELIFVVSIKKMGRSSGLLRELVFRFISGN